MAVQIGSKFCPEPFQVNVMMFDLKYWFSSFNVLLFAEVSPFFRPLTEMYDKVTFVIIKNNKTTLSTQQWWWEAMSTLASSVREDKRDL